MAIYFFFQILAFYIRDLSSQIEWLGLVFTTFFSLPLCRSVIRTHDSRVAPYWDLLDALPTVAAAPFWYRGYTFTLWNYQPASVLTWFIYFFVSVKPLSTNFFCWQLMLAKQYKNQTRLTMQSTLYVSYKAEKLNWIELEAKFETPALVPSCSCKDVQNRE